jgi:3-hydroxyisobutyrate dehydrogenase-like beta-hydroxyacid dehydrogenase
MNIGFIGIGRMGRPMAGRLLAAGHKTFIYDVSKAACAPSVEKGAVLCATPADVARNAVFIVTSLPGPTEVDAVVDGPDGVLSAVCPGTIIIETSTIGPEQSRRLGACCTKKQASFLDAPVSGGVPSAEAGDLTAIVGGDKDVLEKARPVIDCFAKRIYHMGSLGTGNAAKLINQIVFLSYVALFCESAALGERAGLDVPTLLEALRTSVAGKPLMNGWEKHIEAGDFSPGFQINRVLKDMELGAEMCASESFNAPVFQAAINAFRKAAKLGRADRDMTALYEIARSE